jgi:hypothetical protein
MTQEKNKQQEKLDKRAAKLRENLKRRKAVQSAKNDKEKTK